MLRVSRIVIALAIVSSLGAGIGRAKGTMPEDLLKGRIIFSDKPLPTRWSSVSSYVGQLKGLHKTTMWYDKKTGKLKIQYAAFFADPLNDVQVDLVIYDITNGSKDRKAVTEQFLDRRGERVLFNSVEFDKEDFEMNKKYLIAIVNRGKTLASGDFILRGEGPHYSGKVNFSEEETKEK